jgi:hypothetical protein
MPACGGYLFVLDDGPGTAIEMGKNAMAVAWIYQNKN